MTHPSLHGHGDHDVPCLSPTTDRLRGYGGLSIRTALAVPVYALSYPFAVALTEEN